MTRVLVGIETGGTKIMAAVADAATGEILDRFRMATSDPGESLGALDGWIEAATAGAEIVGAGIAAFGPLNLDRTTPGYATLTVTPKLSWIGASLIDGLPVLRDAPLSIVTDVTGAAIGERDSGAAQGLSRVAYVTIGTGVGAGVILDGVPVVGGGDHELGHILVRRHLGDVYPGHCPYHGDCLEGMACGPALRARYGMPAEELSPDLKAEAAQFVGDYAAQLVWTLRLAFSVQRVVIGGGVMEIPGAREELRARLAEIAGEEITAPDGGEFVVAPALGGEAGLRGALVLARDVCA